jgi:VanZ family protein
MKKRPAIAVGVLAATIVEVGQLALPTRVASPTDLIFGAAGGWLGAATALRLRAYGFGTLPPPPKSPVRFKVK